MRKRTRLEDYDWNLIQKEHDAGLLYIHISRKFKMSISLLNNAVKRGLLRKIIHKKIHTEESKRNLSEKRTKYLKDNPDKVPYLLNHSSKESYPEKYFKDVFENEKIDLKYHKQIGFYQLDFYNEEFKIDIEIDGDQHHLDKRIKASDERRTKFLENLGWKIFRIKWSDYQKLSFEEKRKFISQIKDLFDEESNKERLSLVVQEKRWNCLDCGVKVYKKNLYCPKCSSKRRRKFSISDEELSRLIGENKSYSEIGRIFGVSSNAVRRRWTNVFQTLW